MSWRPCISNLICDFILKKLFNSGAAWEDIVGYSRAVLCNNQLEVSGTTAVENSEVLYPGDPYLQTKCILEKIKVVLEQAGSSLEDVVRTRIYVTDIAHWEAVGRAHGEFFSSIKPACTMVEVSALIDPKLLVEIEASAILS